MPKAISDLVVRPMLRADLPSVAALEGERPGPPWTRLDFQPSAGAGGLVAEAGGRVIGYAAYHKQAGSVAVLDVAVAPDRRRQGIARALLSGLHRRHAGPFRATISEWDLPAQLLLRGAGYKAVRVLRGHFGGADGYIMERPERDPA